MHQGIVGIESIINQFILSWFIIFGSLGGVFLLNYCMFKYREFMDFRFPNPIPQKLKKKLITDEMNRHSQFYSASDTKEVDKKEKSINS